MPFEVSTTRGIEIGLDGAELGNADLKVGKELQQKRLELLVGAVHFVDQQHRRRGAADGGKQRPFEKILLRENMLLDRVGIFADAFARFYREQLALIIPLVKRGVLIEALVALQPDQLGAVHGGKRLADLGLADAGLALEQQRPFEEIHQPQRGRDVAVGDIADGGELVRDFFALEGHQRIVIPSWPGSSRPSTSSVEMPIAWIGRHDGSGMTQVTVAHPCSPSFSAAVQVRQ